MISLYIQHRDGVPDEDRRRLYQHARLTLADQDAINALSYMGVKISKVRSIVGPGLCADIPLSRALTTKTRRNESNKNKVMKKNTNFHDTNHC